MSVRLIKVKSLIPLLAIFFETKKNPRSKISIKVKMNIIFTI